MPAASRPFFDALSPDSGGETSRQEIHLTSGDGELIPVLATMNRIIVEEEHEVCCLIVSDLTEKKRGEEMMVHSRRKDEFLAMLAHELRNPLAPLRNSIEIMKHGLGGDGVLPRATATMDRQLTHLQRLVDDLLDIARISRDQIELRREVLDLRGVIEQAVETCRPLADRAGIDLRFGAASEAVYVDGDAIRLAQVFANLLNNACKYTDRGGCVSIELGTTATLPS